MPISVAHMTQRYRVFLVDDHPVVRQGLSLLINQEADLIVCGEAEAAWSVPAALAALNPDVLVLDLSLNGPDGLDLLKSIRATQRSLPILILSVHDESMYAERALRAGANGYIMKQEATERVLIAIRRVLGGELYVSDRIANTMLQQLTKQGSSPQSLISTLSDRELEVFRLIGDGHGTREIAEELRLSIKTVESYQAHIKDKLSLPSARALMQRAIEWRLSSEST
ncbi:MAG TPA: response regulator transcription factor [Gemmatimonadaceae bacterium]|nr:response regulator transcription factor [Gemmatimonadaceae bacterium]